MLYHGSSRLVDILEPYNPPDSRENEPLVYASNKNIATIMGILRCPGVLEYKVMWRSEKGIIYSGKPEQDIIYLYTLERKAFSQTHPIEWVSPDPVTPTDVEILTIDDYIPRLVRYASAKEIEEWHIRKNS